MVSIQPSRIDPFPKCSFYPMGELPERNASVAIVKPLFLLLHGVDMEVTKNDCKIINELCLLLFIEVIREIT